MRINFLFFLRSCIFAAFEKQDSTLKALKPFDIAFVGLPTGIHEFLFELNDDFFACFSGSEITHAGLNARVILYKKNNMFDLEFFIDGKVELGCDMCMEDYWQELDVHKMLYIKFGEKYEEQSDDVIIIPSTESHLDISQYLFEFVILGLPAKRVHPGGKKKEDNCDPKIIEQLDKYLTIGKNKESNKEKDSKPADSRWDALKNLKFN